jgi:ribosomal protein S18 acetylase RimI-like enzyme
MDIKAGGIAVVGRHRLGTCQNIDQVPVLHAALEGGSFSSRCTRSALQRLYQDGGVWTVDRLRYWDLLNFENVADNLRESFRVIAASRGAGEVRELRGVSIAAAGVTFQMFNAAFLSEPVQTEAELAQRVMLASVHFNARGLEWAYWVCEGWLENRTRKRSRQVFERLGLRHSVDLPGMVAERVAPPVKPQSAIDVRRVSPGSTRDAFCAIGSVCFHVPLVWFHEVFDDDSVWKNFAAYVGYVDEEPVSTTAIVMGGAAVGVYNVATLPSHQHRGYGEAVMRYAIEEARSRTGVERTILQSTPAGLKLYERMGFRTVTRVSVYSA